MPALATTAEAHTGRAPQACARRILDAVPTLRAFARSLEPDRGKADGLVRKAVTKVMAAGPLVAGADLRVGLLTMLRSSFHEERREFAAAPLFVPVDSRAGATPPRRGGLRQALERLPAEEIEALMLVSGLGLSHLQAAAICGTDVGAVKRRAARARKRLRETTVATTMNRSLPSYTCEIAGPALRPRRGIGSPAPSALTPSSLRRRRLRHLHAPAMHTRRVRV